MAKKPKAPKEVTVARPEMPTIDQPRPVPFSGIFGHDRALGILGDALRSDRLHHCWILHGPRGVGKFTAALSFASVLLDPTARPGNNGRWETDPESETQKLLAAGTHPDLHIVVKELTKYHPDPEVRKKKLTTIPIDVLRDFLIQPAKLAPSLRTTARAGKVFIVDEAELLAAAGQNALLKVLEEPPSRVVILLVTSSEDQLLPTIRSRSQRVYFSPLADHEMQRWLDLANPDAPNDERQWLAEFAAGSPGVFMQARAMGLHEWWKKIGPLMVPAAKGEYQVDLGGTMASLADAWAKAQTEDTENASKETFNRIACEWMFRLAGTYIHRRLREAARSADARAAVRPFLAMLDKLREAEAEVDANVHPTFALEKLASEVAAA
ncbi:MAG: AAA family ATPase [Phycisphaerae bacterium]|nr:AAA family ATPase [Phycisphaerae bacterium]